MNYESKFVFPPFKHQKVGIQKLVEEPTLALFDEMGVGKTYQIINAAQILYKEGKINAVLVVCPASVRAVWDDIENGEIKKFSWVEDYRVQRFDSSNRAIPKVAPLLSWFTISYSFLRNILDTKNKGWQKRTDPFIQGISRYRFLLVLDESSYVKSNKAAQRKACWKLRNTASRVAILNGTPIANNVMDLWGQFDILNPEIIDHMNYYQFRYRYAKMGGYMMKQIVGQNELEVQRLKEVSAPYVLRREKRDCLDIPPKTYTTREIELSPKTYIIYQEMKNDMISWLDEQPSFAKHGGVKVMRLSQITSGFLGGIEDPLTAERMPVKEIGDEKLKAFMEFVDNFSFDSPIIVWCRFRAEIERMVRRLEDKKFNVAAIYGGSGNKDQIQRDFQNGKIDILVGNPQAGGLGLNLQICNTVVYLSNDYSLISRLQSEDRAHRGDKRESVTYVDFLSVNPMGRKTIDHAVYAALKKKENLAEWTTDHWRNILLEA